MSRVVLPDLDTLAWAPVVAVTEIEMFDRYNGVPTLGTFTADGQVHLFWRALGYTSDISLWLYVPLTREDRDLLDAADSQHLLDGIVFGLDEPRYVTVGVADANRLVFEREWRLAARRDPANLVQPLLEFVDEALEIALAEDLPATRRELVRKAHDAVSQLTHC